MPRCWRPTSAAPPPRVGDPLNIIIGSRAGLSFNDFLINLGPIVLIELVVFTLVLPRLFRCSVTADPARIADVMKLNEREIEPPVVALLGAGVLVLVSRAQSKDYLAAVEWETLLFFAGLFIMIGALVKTGVIGDLAKLAADATGGNALLVVSALLSGLIGNISRDAVITPVRLSCRSTNRAIIAATSTIVVHRGQFLRLRRQQILVAYDETGRPAAVMTRS